MSKNKYSNFLTKDELIQIGFQKIGKDIMVSRDARFYDIDGTLGDNVRIDSFAILTGQIRLGNGVHISPFCFLGGTGGVITMDDFSGLSTHVSIFTKSDSYGIRDPEKISKDMGDVYIGRKSIIGKGAVIMPNAFIAEYVSIGANCVINGIIEKGSVIISRGTGIIAAGNRT